LNQSVFLKLVVGYIISWESGQGLSTFFFKFCYWSLGVETWIGWVGAVWSEPWVGTGRGSVRAGLRADIGWRENQTIFEPDQGRVRVGHGFGSGPVRRHGSVRNGLDRADFFKTLVGVYILLFFYFWNY
jgi:hypothetical protein